MREGAAGLTYDLDPYVSAVQHVLNLDGQRVRPGVAPLRRADEQDGVHFAGARPHRPVLQGGAVFEPGHGGTRLALQNQAELRDVWKTQDRWTDAAL